MDIYIYISILLEHNVTKKWIIEYNPVAIPNQHL